MRILVIALGACAILAYSVLGALLMTDWEVTAASGLPLDETIAEMQAANQPYGVISGVVFAAVGGLLAIAWVSAMLVPAIPLSAWFALASWAAVIALGAPAYFFASFGNMNSVGDTFLDWNSDAAFALASPLYLTSGIAALVATIALVIGSTQARARKPVPPQPHSRSRLTADAGTSGRSATSGS